MIVANGIAVRLASETAGVEFSGENG